MARVAVLGVAVMVLDRFVTAGPEDPLFVAGALLLAPVRRVGACGVRGVLVVGWVDPGPDGGELVGVVFVTRVLAVVGGGVVGVVVDGVGDGDGVVVGDEVGVVDGAADE